MQHDSGKPIDQTVSLAMMIDAMKQPQLAQPSPSSDGRIPMPGNVFTPVEIDMFRLALRREPQRARELFRQQAGVIMAAINRIRAAPSEYRVTALAAELRRFQAQGGALNEALSQVPLQRVDQLLDFLEQRAAGLLQLVEDDDRLDQLDQMLVYEAEQEEKDQALTKQTFQDSSPLKSYDPESEGSSLPEESEVPEAG